MRNRQLELLQNGIDVGKNVTAKYDKMISAFSADFNLAINGDHKLTELQQMIEKKNEKLLADIDLLDELDYGIRNGTLIIREVTQEQ